MKKIIFLILIIMILLVGCGNIKNIFIEPEGYTIVEIEKVGFFSSNKYGYVKNEDLEKYKNNNINYLEVFYPYKNKHQGEKILVDVKLIETITIGIYKDIR